MKNELGTGKTEREGGGETGPLVLSDIIDVPAIQSMMDDFFALTNIGVAVLDIKGKVLVATGWQDICTKFHRVHPETSRHCVESDTLLSRGVKPGTFKIYRCKNHMWDMATPIMVGGQHVGNLFLGQFLFADEQPDYILFREQARKYGFDEREYLSALDRVPRWEKEKVNRVMTFYSKFAQLISELSYANLRLARTLKERNTLFHSLQKSEEQYRNLVQNSNDIIWAFDLASQNFTFASDALERILGYPMYPMDTAPNMTMDDVFSSETKKEVMAAFGKAGGRGSPEGRMVVEAEHRHHNGSFVWMEISATAVKDADGKVVGFAGVTRDISERKMAEDVLREQETLLRQVIDALPYPVFVKDREGRFLLLNKATADLFGARVKDVLGKKSTDFHFSYDIREPFRKNDLDVIESGIPRFISEEMFPDHEGNQRCMQTVKIPIRWPGRTEYVALGVSVDLTDRKKSEALRQQSEEELQWLFKKMFNAFVLFESVFDSDGRFMSYRFVRINEAYERITGVKNEEVKGKTVHEVWPDTEPEWIRRYGEVAVTGISQTFDLYHDPTKKFYHCNVYRPWDTKDRFCVIFEDITEQKRLEADRAALQEQNWQLQKAESLGRMAGAIAHHFNNQLQAVMGNLEMIMQDVPGSLESFETCTQAMNAAREAARVSNQMLTYLGQTVGTRESLDLAEACWLVLSVLQSGMSGNIVLKTDLPSPGPAVSVNRSQLGQVLTNLLNNAQEAMAGGSGGIQVAVSTVSSVDIPATHRFPIDWKPEAEAYACIEVKDEGPGILEQDLVKLFDPFFSTKFTGRGLGLSMALGIVRAHGGCITVESRVGPGVGGQRSEVGGRRSGVGGLGPGVRGRGAEDRGRRSEVRDQRSEDRVRTLEALGVLVHPVAPEDGTGASLRENWMGSVFRVYLPLSVETVPQRAEKVAEFQQVQAGGLVLLVEDTEQVRKLGVRMLELLGFTVLAAKDGVEGVEIFRERRDDIGFVLCDLTMPRMDGWKTVEALRKIRPDIRVILASGYDEASVMSGDHLEWPQTFLAKPYSLEDLREAIGRTMEPQMDTDGHR